MNKIRIGIVGYGNLGVAAESAVNAAPDMELVAVFTRRSDSVKIKSEKAQVESMVNLVDYKDKIDVMLLCSGSATDVPAQMPLIAPHFSFADCFDTHAEIPKYLESADKLLKGSKHTAAVATGWDPGLFSLIRAINGAVLPVGETHTFWGEGVSQGHSDAIRRIKGVKRAVQYTVPKQEAVEIARQGGGGELSTKNKHTRKCFVVIEENADEKEIERQIREMPNYFLGYDTTVSFISEAEFDKKHTDMPHGGLVLHRGDAADGSRHLIEYSLKLDSNPAFTASVLICYARAVYRLNKHGVFGALTVLDIAPTLLSVLSRDELIKTLL